MAFLRVVQIKSLLLGSDGMYGTVLHTAARGGNIGVWAALVDGLKKERLLEEVGVDESGTFPSILRRRIASDSRLIFPDRISAGLTTSVSSRVL